METIQLSYLLYNIDEVKYSFMLSILFQNKHTFHESLFWAYELYKSCHKEYLWNFITKIYYDFYYIKYISFEKVLDIEYNAWKTKPDFKHIDKIIKDLHKQVIDITIFQSYYRNKNKIPDLINNITIDKLKKNIPNAISYLKPLNIDEIKQIYKTKFRFNKRKEKMCLFYTNQKHKWIVKLVSKLVKKKQIHIKTKLNKENIKSINQFDIPCISVYKTLKEKRLYPINDLIGSFKLARFKNETDVVNVWNESFGYICDDIDRYKSAYLHHWEYYANKTPFWNEIFINYDVSFKKKEIQFPNNDILDEFYETYGFEPDEQNIETQMKSIKSIKPITINECFNVYDTPLKETIKQITYCIN